MQADNNPHPEMTATTTTPPPPTTNASPPPRDTVVDQRVVALRGMFPDYDDLILQSVLDSAGGNQDRAIDILLGMTDPDFHSESPAQPVPQAPVLSQTDLDEQFARQLVLQEQQQETQLWLQTHPDATRPPPGVYHSSRPLSGAAAGAQTAGRYPQQQGSGPQAERPSEFQEQFTKIAETGKKTFGNIFSKVKAKLQEFEQGRPPNQQPSTSAPYPPYASHPGQQTWSPPQSQAQAAYFDPNSNPASVPSPARSAPAATALQGYDVSSASPISSSPPTTTTTQLQREPSPQPQPSINTIPPPPSTSQGAPIDAGKFGIMPKRPVSLLRDPNPNSGSAGSAGLGTAAAVGGVGGVVGAGAAAHLLDDDDYNDHVHNDDDDDGLEYAENPFEDNSAAVGKK